MKILARQKKVFGIVCFEYFCEYLFGCIYQFHCFQFYLLAYGRTDYFFSSRIMVTKMKMMLVNFGDVGEDDEFENQIPSSSPTFKSLLLVSVFQLLVSYPYPPTPFKFLSVFSSPPSFPSFSDNLLIFARLAFYLSFMFRFPLHRGLLLIPFFFHFHSFVRWQFQNI